MKKLYAFYVPHASGGYVVECYMGGRWECTFRHEGDFDSLYTECERRAQLREARIEAVVSGLPTGALSTQTEESTALPAFEQQQEFAMA
jgi:hypothetical protein